ncbi:MAG TPA: DUF4332 domain-containing protein, partial [Candidatus Sumerlaeota bacterium]|nr:DUF4332 domain-containing protein [Candidatus Sumerlaeota bacterium]
MSNQEKRIPFYARDLWIAGLVGLPLGHWFLFAQIEPFYSGIYTFLWWPFIFVLDFLVYRLRHESLLQDRPREFLLLTLWSTPVWLLFEAFNFRLQNWTYIQVPLLWSDLSSWFMIPAYATVLPALFEGADLVSAVIERLTHGRGLQGRPFQVNPRHVKIQMAVGVAMLVLPMLWPGLFFCMIWGFAFFFFDPFCYRRQGPSLLGQLSKGHLTRLVALLLSGLMCGGLWEAWNIVARSKWLYTVPGFENLKLFEMPVLGFLGFPPFALECYALVNVINLFRGGRSWERRGLDNLRGRGMRPRVALWTWTAIIVFSCLVYEGIFLWSVTSYSIPLEDLLGSQLNRRERLILWNEGVRFPHQFLARWGQATPESETEEKISAVLPHGFDPESFVRLRALSTLSEIKGIGLHHAVTLESLGVRTPLDLVQQDPDALVAQMSQAVRADLAPSEAVARIWIGAAKKWARRYAPAALQEEESNPWEENGPDDEDTSCSATAGHPLDLDREAEASSRTQSPTFPQAIHQTETTTQPRELTIFTTATKTLQSVSNLPETSATTGTAEIKGTSGTVVKQAAAETTSPTQPVKPEDTQKTTPAPEQKTEPGKAAEESSKSQSEPSKPQGEQKTTSATEPVQPATETKKTSDTQTVKPGDAAKEEVKKPEEKPQEEPRADVKQSEEKQKDETKKPEEKPREEARKTEEKPKEEPQKAQKETSAAERAKPATETEKTSDTQTVKPGDSPKEAVKKSEEKSKEEPRADVKRPEEKPKEDVKKSEEASKKSDGKPPESTKKSEEKPKEEALKPEEPSKKPEEKPKEETKKLEEKPKEEVKKSEETSKKSEEASKKSDGKPPESTKKSEEKPKEEALKPEEPSKK